MRLRFAKMHGQGNDFVVLDGGRTEQSGPAPVLVRLSFPEAWRIVLIGDPVSDGIHGERELKAFAALEPFPPSAAAQDRGGKEESLRSH